MLAFPGDIMGASESRMHFRGIKIEQLIQQSLSHVIISEPKTFNPPFLKFR